MWRPCSSIPDGRSDGVRACWPHLGGVGPIEAEGADAAVLGRVQEAKEGACVGVRVEEGDIRLVGRVHREDLDLVGELPPGPISPRREGDAPEDRVLGGLVKGGSLAAAVTDEHRKGEGGELDGSDERAIGQRDRL